MVSDVFDAWHLPGLDPDELTYTSYRLGALDVRAPVLTQDQITCVLQSIERRRAALLQTPTNDLVDAIDAVAKRLADPQSREGAAARALLPAVSGYSQPVVEDILAHMTRDWQRTSLEQMLVAELGSVTALDGPAQDHSAGRYAFARGPALAYQVFSGNVPGVAVTAMIRCLLVKAPQLGKTASGEPVLPLLFVQALADVNPSLAECVAISYWPGGSSDAETRALRHADTVIVYGGSEAVAAISNRVSDPTRVIVHGPKLSIGIVGRAASSDVAADIAYAVAAYDQQGCVSPHAIYVERNGAVAPKQLARAVASALADLSVSYPRRNVDASEANAIRAARTRVEFRASENDASEVFSSDDTSYTVIYDEDTTLLPSCLNRTVYIKPVERAQNILPLLQPHRGTLQSVAIAGFSAKEAHAFALMLADCGVTRVASFQALPWPPMWWHHDGRGVLSELLTWHDVEAL